MDSLAQKACCVVCSPVYDACSCIHCRSSLVLAGNAAVVLLLQSNLSHGIAASGLRRRVSGYSLAFLHSFHAHGVWPVAMYVLLLSQAAGRHAGMCCARKCKSVVSVMTARNAVTCSGLACALMPAMRADWGCHCNAGHAVPATSAAGQCLDHCQWPGKAAARGAELPAARASAACTKPPMTDQSTDVTVQSTSS
jgi:hypothetical protein